MAGFLGLPVVVGIEGHENERLLPQRFVKRCSAAFGSSHDEEVGLRAHVESIAISGKKKEG